MSTIDEKTLLEAIARAGYLLEAKVAELLTKQGLFVESNIMIEDPLTGKSREIDLLAQFDVIYREITDYTIANIDFICEVKNNPYPFILLSKFQDSPHTELWDSIKNMVTLPDIFHKKDRYSLLHDLDFYDELTRKKIDLYTQYCSFQPKKSNEKNNELMAWHPDYLYESLTKITMLCEKKIEWWDDKKTDKYFRDYLFMPVLIIRDDLYELELGEGEADAKLKKVKQSYLIHNYHYNSEPKSAIIFVVTFDGLVDFLKQMAEIKDKVEDNLIKLREKGSA